MEFPVKIDLPKLSHLHILEFLLPLVPGIVVTTGLSIGDSRLSQKLWNLGLGYKSKLALIVALSYIIGIAMIVVLDTCATLIMQRIWKPVRSVIPWENSYWRRIAESYVGGVLSPQSASFPDTAELIRAAQSAIGRYKEAPDIQSLLPILQKNIQELERIKDTIANVPVKKVESSEVLSKATSATSKLPELKEVLQEGETKLKFIGTEYEWRSLHSALEMLPAPVSPYSGFRLLMTAAQASGIGALWLMIQYKELRNLPGFIFFGLVVISASHALGLLHRVNGAFTDLNSFQIAAMIKELRSRSDAKGESENQKKT